MLRATSSRERSETAGPDKPTAGSANVNEEREWTHHLFSTDGALTNVRLGTRPPGTDTTLSSHPNPGTDPGYSLLSRNAE